MKKKRNIVVAVSGGWDPLHIGHVRLMQEAKKLGDELVVIINNDNWLEKKRGYVFIPEKERKEIIEALEAVDRAVLTAHRKGFKDRSVCKELEKIRPDIFANGGDRTSDNIPEVKTCKKINCDMVFNVGRGGKVQSSSWILEEHFKNKKTLKFGSKHTFRIREKDRKIFDALYKGTKKIETRAATKRYRSIKAGDIIKFVCGGHTFERKVKKVKIFKTVRSLLKNYKPKDINPEAETKKDLEAMYSSFPQYAGKIREHGILALEFE